MASRVGRELDFLLVIHGCCFCNLVSKILEETKMKRNLVLSIAVAVFMLTATVAQAADVTFGGEFRPRFNVDNDFTDTTNPTHFFDTRVRLNAKAKVNANTEVFLQFQSVGTWGQCNRDSGDTDMGANQTGGCVGTRESTGGATGPGDAAEASDLLNDVGFHQAFLTLKNFAGYDVDAKIGRQEVVLDGHRLFGHTGWTQGAETKDAIRLTHAAGNHAINYVYIHGNEADGAANNNDADYGVHVVHAATQGVLGGSLSGIFTVTNNDDGSNESGDNEQWYTIGARQKGKLGGLDYRVEYYHQFGDAGTIANTAGLGTTGATGANAASGVDRDAQMFGVRIGKTFKNASWKPSVTLWYDNLSGNDDDDRTGGDWGQFDTMYDTGHKFFGFQDFYLNRAGANTGYFGLQDLAVKLKMSPRAGWTFKADYHNFRTQTGIDGSDADATIANAGGTLTAAMDPDMGSELDLTLVHKYDANTKISAGFSHYWSTSTFATIHEGDQAGNNEGSDWAYVQVHTKF